jgi:hypothetical protein
VTRLPSLYRIHNSVNQKKIRIMPRQSGRVREGESGRKRCKGVGSKIKTIAALDGIHQIDRIAASPSVCWTNHPNTLRGIPQRQFAQNALHHHHAEARKDCADSP